jgi:hypothetical protein
MGKKVKWKQSFSIKYWMQRQVTFIREWEDKFKHGGTTLYSITWNGVIKREYLECIQVAKRSSIDMFAVN